MLCEHCHKKEATIDLTIVSWPSGELIKCLCEDCYAEVQAARIHSFATQPTVPLPAHVEDITAEEYLDVSAQAAANGRDKLVMKHIGNELKRFPATRERLAIEMLKVAEKSLEQGGDPYRLIGLGGCFGNSVEPTKSPKFIELLESIIRRSVALMAKSSRPVLPHPFGFGLTLATLALRRADQARFAAALKTLSDQSDESAQKIHSEIIAYLQKQIAQTDQRTRPRKRKAD